MFLSMYIMKQTTLVNINSKDRTSGEIGNFVYRLQESLGNVESIELVGIQLKASNFTINGTNNKLYLKLSDSSEIVITLTIGNYDSDTLLTLIQDALTAVEVGGDNYVVSFDEQDFLFTITSDNNFELQFGTNTLNSVASVLGYRDTNYTGTTTYTAEEQIKLNQDNYSILTDIIESNILTKNGRRSIIYTLPNESSINSMLLFRPKYKLLFKSSKSMITNIRVSILTDNLKVAELNSNFSLQFLITHFQ